MNVKEALAFGAKQLNPTSLKLRGTRKIDSPQLDAAVLLSAAIKKPKEFLYTYPEKKLMPAQIKKYKNYISRRAKHEPVAYILGKKEFYGFEFAVSPAVLIPRPDTEALITAVINATMNYDGDYDIMDVGTGSGAIAVTLKKLLPKARVFASDVSPRSLALAKKNARRLGAKMTFFKGNLLTPFFPHPSSILPSKEGRRNAFPLSPSLEGRRNAFPLSPSLEGETQRGCDLITTANLPYLSRAEWQKTAPEVKKYEPYGALVGGKTGTEIYEKLFKEIGSSLWKREAGRDLLLNPPQSSPSAVSSGQSNCFSEGGRIILFIEIGHNQKPTITKLAKKILHPQKIEFFKDLANHWRVAKITL